jgi:prophage tail gpP-like protein
LALLSRIKRHLHSQSKKSKTARHEITVGGSEDKEEWKGNETKVRVEEFGIWKEDNEEDL